MIRLLGIALSFSLSLNAFAGQSTYSRLRCHAQELNLSGQGSEAGSDIFSLELAYRVLNESNSLRTPLVSFYLIIPGKMMESPSYLNKSPNNLHTAQFSYDNEGSTYDLVLYSKAGSNGSRMDQKALTLHLGTVLREGKTKVGGMIQLFEEDKILVVRNCELKHNMLCDAGGACD